MSKKDNFRFSASHKNAPDWYIKDLESRITPERRAAAIKLAESIPIAKGLLDEAEHDYPLKINPYKK